MSSICQRCGAVIEWQRTEAGEWQPMNLDGTVHFPTCRERVRQGRERVRAWYEELMETASPGAPSHSDEGDGHPKTTP